MKCAADESSNIPHLNVDVVDTAARFTLVTLIIRATMGGARYSTGDIMRKITLCRPQYPVHNRCTTNILCISPYLLAIYQAPCSGVELEQSLPKQNKYNTNQVWDIFCWRAPTSGFLLQEILDRPVLPQCLW